MTKHIIKLLSFCVLLSIISGCAASSHYLNTGISKYPPTKVSDIKIISEREITGKEYIEIGYVSIHNTNTMEGDELKQLVKEEAASIGADAVIGFRIRGLQAGGVAIKYN